MGSCVSSSNHFGKNAAKKQTIYHNKKIRELEQLEQLDKEGEGSLEKISVIYRRHARQIRPLSY
jgi:hypothetical protein